MFRMIERKDVSMALLAIAVVKISRDEPFVAAKIGDSDSLKVGQDVCAIGNPGVTGDVMFEHTLTKGIISGLNRVSLSEGYSLSLIQTDTAMKNCPGLYATAQTAISRR